jgi:striatin 1/3/4
MRFLQSEWHRHERDRNAWDIEKAEMKSRISKLEGDGRTSKRTQESLGKHVKILENALRKEREKVKQLKAGKEEAPVDGDTAKGSPKPGSKPTFVKPHNSFLDTDAEDSANAEIKQDMERDKSRVYLGKCVQEVTYHVIPTTHAQQQIAEEQEQLQQNHQYAERQAPQPTLEEVYGQRPRQQNHTSASGQQPTANHQPPPIPRVLDAQSVSRPPQEQPLFMTRSDAQTQLSNTGPLTSIDTRNPPRQSYGFPPVADENVEKISHSFDIYGQEVPPRESEANARSDNLFATADTDGWNFEDVPEQNQEQLQPTEFVPPSRPDVDAFPLAHNMPLKSPPRGPGSHRRKSSLSKRRQSDGSHELRELSLSQGVGSMKGESSTFKVRFALRGHLDVVRSVIFTGGGTPAEPEICTTGDDGVIKRWIIPASYGSYGPQPTVNSGNDLDISSYFTHRGHTGPVMALAASPASPNFSNGGRAQGDGWVFSGGQDGTVRVWERGRVDPKATLDGHTDAVWTVCVLPGSAASILGDQSSRHGGGERMLLASGSADGTILIWTVSSPPQLTSPHTGGSRRGAGGSRRANSVSSGSNFPSSPQPSTATSTPFHYSLLHRIERLNQPSPTCICPLSLSGDTFVVSYSDASVIIYDTKTAEEVVGMASLETYDGTSATCVNAIAATTSGLDGSLTLDSSRGASEDESVVHGATGSSTGVEGMILSGHEDRYIRFFDANSGTFQILAPFNQMTNKFLQQVNAHIPCLPTLLPLPPYRCPLMAMNSSPLVTMLACASGVLRKGVVRRRLLAIA